jgi:hypothetical protein
LDIAPPCILFILPGFSSLVPGATFLTGQIATALIGVLNCVLMFVLIRNLDDEAGGQVRDFGSEGCCRPMW